MIIKNPKAFLLALGMTLAFLTVLTIMFLPVIHGQNVFHAADGLFNSISKASTNYFPQVKESVAALEFKDAAQRLNAPSGLGEILEKMIRASGQQAEYRDGELQVAGTLKPILVRMVQDAEAMYGNDGEILEKAYGVDPKQAMYAWWIYASASAKDFKLNKRFAAAKVLEEIKTKAVEVGYNYFGVDPTPASDRAGILFLAFGFYIFYTLWWGYSIFFMSEGFGLMMTKSAKKEV